MTKSCISLVAILAFTVPCHAAPRPNVVVILADDLGYADVGFNGCEDIRTPRIDQISDGGVRFTAGYVTHAFCSPSRAGLLTGRYQQRFGHEQNVIFSPDDPDMGLPRDQKTLADALGASGYATGIVGKWHLGAHEELHPLSRGFDFFYGMLSGGHNYFPHLLTIAEPRRHEDGYSSKILKNRERVDETEYLTDGLSREAVGFIERNAEQPFFLYLAYNAPHTPMQVTDEYRSRYPHIENRKRQTYAGMVSAVDDGVGRVLDTLDRLGLTENTLLFFLSDNGGPTKANASENTPLRSGKGHVYEGGLRVPFAFRWDAVLPAGVDYDQPVSSLDIFATSIAAAGAAAPEGQSLDGVDLVPYLTGKREDPPHPVLLWRMKRKGIPAIRSAVRIGDFKLDEDRPREFELYNVAQDIHESNELSESQAERLKEMREVYERWASELVEPKFLGLSQRKQYERERYGSNREAK